MTFPFSSVSAVGVARECSLWRGAPSGREKIFLSNFPGMGLNLVRCSPAGRYQNYFLHYFGGWAEFTGWRTVDTLNLTRLRHLRHVRGWRLKRSSDFQARSKCQGYGLHQSAVTWLSYTHCDDGSREAKDIPFLITTDRWRAAGIVQQLPSLSILRRNEKLSNYYVD